MPVPSQPLVTAIVVSYNVKDPLMDCLTAFYRTTDMPVEAVVVDNASSDGSAEAVAEWFPQAALIRSSQNLGFGRASNLGLEKARGRFILALNPDVTVEPECVGRLVDFLLVRADVGAVGPRLARPDGRLDLAARRGFPTPANAFYRLSGLSQIFPRSRVFARYNMGHLSPDEAHEIDSGTAACLLLRRATLDGVGFFDPDYFMYGEDLDLCYRIREGGWKVYYLPNARALHLKGAATRKRTARMLFEFHRAMWTFHCKHFADGRPEFVNGLIWAGTWLRWLVLSVKQGLTRDDRVSA